MLDPTVPVIHALNLSEEGVSKFLDSVFNILNIFFSSEFKMLSALGAVVVVIAVVVVVVAVVVAVVVVVVVSSVVVVLLPSQPHMSKLIAADIISV